MYICGNLNDMYEIIEKNQYGVLVGNPTDINSCFLCKFKPITCTMVCLPYTNSYYLPDSEVERLESENQLMNTTIDDLYIESKCYFEVKKKLDDTQKELIDLRVELRVEKEKSKALEEYSRGLELNVKELEGTIENNVTELITVTEEVYSGCFSEITKTKCCGIAPITNENFCPNCGRKIVR